MKTILIIIGLMLAGAAQGQSLDKIVGDMIDIKMKGLQRDTVIYVGPGIIMDTAKGKVTLRIDPAYIVTVAKQMMDINSILTIIKNAPPVTTTQRNLMKVTEGFWIYNKSSFRYEQFKGGKWQP